MRLRMRRISWSTLSEVPIFNIGLEFKGDSLEKKLMLLNAYCNDLEICMLLDKLEGRWEHCLSQMVASPLVEFKT
jgi:hypothetical protein